MYYTDPDEGTSLPPKQASAEMDKHGWSDGWRIQDADMAIWLGGCDDTCEFQSPPFFFVLNTATMRIDATYLLDYDQIIEAITEIDNTY